MADKTIGQLNPASQVTPTDLFVLEQSSTAKSLSGQILTNWLLGFVQGHGGIQSIEKTSTSGLVDTYTITLTDSDYPVTFTVTNGKGISSVTTYYAVSSSGSTVPSNWSTTRQSMDATNRYLWSYQRIAFNDNTHTDTVKTVIGVYGNKGNKGDTGETGPASSIVDQSVTYCASASGTEAPITGWNTEIPSVNPGYYLWTRTALTFNDGTETTAFSVSRNGINGTGAVSTVNSQNPDANGNVALTASNIPYGSEDVKTGLDARRTSTAQDTIDAAQDARITAIENTEIIVVNISSYSGSQVRVPTSGTNSAITANHVVIGSTIGTPARKNGDWTVTTYNGYLTLSGDATGSTAVKLVLGKSGTTI